MSYILSSHAFPGNQNYDPGIASAMLSELKECILFLTHDRQQPLLYYSIIKCLKK